MPKILKFSKFYISIDKCMYSFSLLQNAEVGVQLSCLWKLKISMCCFVWSESDAHSKCIAVCPELDYSLPCWKQIYILILLVSISNIKMHFLLNSFFFLYSKCNNYCTFIIYSIHYNTLCFLMIVIIFPYSRWWNFLYSTKQWYITLHLRHHTILSPTFMDTKT